MWLQCFRRSRGGHERRIFSVRAESYSIFGPHEVQILDPMRWETRSKICWPNLGRAHASCLCRASFGVGVDVGISISSQKAGELVEQGNGPDPAFLWDLWKSTEMNLIEALPAI